MPLPFHNSEITSSFMDEDWILTMKLATAVVVADVGKAMAADTVANRAKLCGDNEPIIGRLETFENRQSGKVGAVSLKGVYKLPKTGSVVVGGSVVGSSTAGVVKAAPVVTPTTAVAFTAAQLAALTAPAKNRVIEFDDTANTVTIVIV